MNVGVPDLAVGLAWVSTSVPLAGQSFNLTVTVRNQGPDVAGATTPALLSLGRRNNRRIPTRRSATATSAALPVSTAWSAGPAAASPSRAPVAGPSV